MKGAESNLPTVRYIISRYVHVFPSPAPAPLFRPSLCASRVPLILGPLSYAKPSSALHCGALWDWEPRSSLPHLVYFPPSPPRLFRTPSRALSHPHPLFFSLSPLSRIPLISIAFYSSLSPTRRDPLTWRDSFQSFYFFRFLEGTAQGRKEARGGARGSPFPFFSGSVK